MKTTYFLVLTLLLFGLSLFCVASYFTKTELLNNFDHLEYISGNLASFSTQHNGFSNSTVHKYLDIQLQESAETFRDGPYLLAGLDGQSFIDKAQVGKPIELGFNRVGADRPLRLYDVKFNGVSIVEASSVRWRLQLEQWLTLPLAVGFFLYGLKLIKDKMRKGEAEKA